MEVLLLLLLFFGVAVLMSKQARLAERLGAAEAMLEELRDQLSRRDVAEAPSPTTATEPQPAPPPDPSRWLLAVGARPAAPVGDEIEEEEYQEPAESETFGRLFERFVAGRLLIWVGGAALVVAAMFLIRYSIEVGLLTPSARMIGAAVFGLLLVAAGEYARSGRWLSDDLRVSQALVGAGIVILYAAPYGSYVLYGLIGDRTASLLMLLVTAAALFLSLRHGAATALMGLIGGFLTPVLVGNSDSGAVPLLAYLTLLNAALFGVAWRRGWTWLAALAVVLSFLWSGAFLGAAARDALPAGFFVLALAIVAALLKPGTGRQMTMIQPLLLGLLELAVLVGRTDLGLAAWAMFGALAVASLALSLLRREHLFAPPAALALALFLLAGKATGDAAEPLLPWVAGAITVLFAGFCVPLAPRGDRLLRTTMACAAIAGPVLILRAARPELLDLPLWGTLAILLAVAALLLAWLQRGRPVEDERPDPALMLCAATAALLLGVAAADLLPADLVAGAWVAIALLIAFAGRRLRETGFTLVALAAAGAAVARAVAMVPELWATVAASLVGEPAVAGSLPAPGDAFWALVVPAVLLIALGRLLWGPRERARRALVAAAGLFALAAAYIFAKQVFGIASGEQFAAWGFAERTAITQSLFVIGWLLASRRLPLTWFEEGQAAWLGSIVAFIAALRVMWFDILLHNPVIDEQWVGTMPVLNLLLPAYLLSAFWLYDARRRADAQTRSGFWLSAFLAALIVGTLLMVRQLFQGAVLTASDLPIAEFYGYSLAGLLVAVALLLAGIRLPDKALRLAGLVLLTATIFKVFLIDASALTGLLRILSFLGLGVALIGIGKLYGPVLRAESGGARAQA